jgi:hypothetical protein
MYTSFVEEGLFVTDLKDRFSLSETDNYVIFVSTYQQEHDNRFNEKFLETPAMQNDVCKKTLFKDRHIFCRYARYGFHNQICSESTERIPCYEESDLYYACVNSVEKSVLNIILPNVRNELTPSIRTAKTLMFK